MHLKPEYQDTGRENFCAAIGSDAKGPGGTPSQRTVLEKRIEQGLAAGGIPGYAYFGYEPSIDRPLRIGVIGTGDEGSVLIGALNPEFIEVGAIADIRPYNQYRALHGDLYSETAAAVRPGLMKKYGWKTDEEAKKNVKVYGPYEELLANAKDDGLEAVIIALPLHLHAPASVAAMRAGLHVLTEKLMGHSVHECKEMARVAKETHKHLATGHQRHYNILYANAVELIRRGVLGDLHYIRAQWHRGNLPGSDSWQQPMPKGLKPDDALVGQLERKLASWTRNRDSYKDDAKRVSDYEKWSAMVAQVEAQLADEILAEKDASGKTLAERLGYESSTLKDAQGNVIYSRPAAEELIRWRLWDRTGGGLMAELGSHQLDAAGIFISAVHGGQKQYPLSVAAAGARPLFPADRDVDDHMYCLFEFPAPGYDPADPDNEAKRIGVHYASINGNGYGGYGETVLGTDGTLLLQLEQQAMLYKTSAVDSRTKVTFSRKQGKPVLDLHPDGDETSAAVGRMAIKDADRGYQQQIEHWAWCIRNNPEVKDPEKQPRCHPKVALGDAVIALTTNIAAKEGRRIEFDKAWFDPQSDATPEGVKPDVTRYKS